MFFASWISKPERRDQMNHTREYLDQVLPGLKKLAGCAREVTCEDVWIEKNTCQLCGKDHIWRNVKLWNTSNGKRLVIGRECARNIPFFLACQGLQVRPTLDSLVLGTGKLNTVLSWLQGAAGWLLLDSPGDEEGLDPWITPEEEYLENALEGVLDDEDGVNERWEHLLELGLDPWNPQFDEVAAEGLGGDEVDWEAADYDSD
jgi:hypothetical protein